MLLPLAQRRKTPNPLDHVEVSGEDPDEVVLSEDEDEVLNPSFSFVPPAYSSPVSPLLEEGLTGLGPSPCEETKPTAENASPKSPELQPVVDASLGSEGESPLSSAASTFAAPQPPTGLTVVSWKRTDFYERERDRDWCLQCRRLLGPEESPTSARVQSNTVSGSSDKMIRHLLNKHNIRAVSSDQAPVPSGIEDLTPERRERVDMALARLVAEDCHALRMVETEAFKDFCWCLHPNFSPPSRGKLTQNLLPAMKNRTAREIRAIVENSEVSATMDGWSGPGGGKYLTMTVDAIDDSWQLHRFVLDLIPSDGQSEDAKHIAHQATKILAEDPWKLSPKRLVALTTDGGPNVKSAVSRLSLPWLWCAAHVANLMVHKAMDGVPELKQLRHQAADLCLFFRKIQPQQVLRASMDKLPVEDSPIPGAPSGTKSGRWRQGKVYKLKLECSTRWDSLYDMLYRLLQCRRAISDALTQLVGLSDLPPLPDWTALKAVCTVLADMKTLTVEMSKSRARVGDAFHMFGTIAQETLNPVQRDSAVVTAMKQVMLQYLKTTTFLTPSKAPIEVLLALFFDPRTKDFTFVKDKQEQGLCLVKAKQEVARLLRSNLDEPLPSSPKRQRVSSGGRRSLWARGNDLEQTVPESELNVYLQRPTVHGERFLTATDRATLTKTELADRAVPGDEHMIRECPLHWWARERETFPRLARRYLCISPSSVASERVFSKSGWILNKRRMSLANTTLSTLTFLSCNGAYNPFKRLRESPW